MTGSVEGFKTGHQPPAVSFLFLLAPQSFSSAAKDLHRLRSLRQFNQSGRLETHPLIEIESLFHVYNKLSVYDTPWL